MDGNHWLRSIKARRRRRTVVSALAGGACVLIYLGVVAGAFWAWREVFGGAPPAELMLWLANGVGSVLVFVIGSRLPQAPAPGEDPEVAAAKAFLEGPRR